MTTSPPPFTLRAAAPCDLDAIVALIRELAAFERLGHLLQVTPDKLRPHLFGERPAAEALVAVADAGSGGGAAVDDQRGADHEAGRRSGQVVGFALFFTSFSTFLAQPGLYLEDLYVQPHWRGHGIGEALLTRLAGIAVARGCGRFEWSVLDWNADAIRFYEKMGATVMPDWRVCRVTGDALARLGGG